MGRSCHECIHHHLEAYMKPCGTCYGSIDRPGFQEKPKPDNVKLQVFGGPVITVGLSDLAEQDALCNKMLKLSDGHLSDDELNLFDGLKRLLGSIAGIE